MEVWITGRSAESNRISRVLGVVSSRLRLASRRRRFGEGRDPGQEPITLERDRSTGQCGVRGLRQAVRDGYVTSALCGDLPRRREVGAGGRKGRNGVDRRGRTYCRTEDPPGVEVAVAKR